MKKRILLSVVLGTAICSLFFHAGAESISVLLEKGIYLEETRGDLDAAIEIYRKIMDESKSNRTYAAQANYRLGMCYMKKGDKAESVKIFKDFVTKYPEQKDLVEKAFKYIPKEPKTENDWGNIRGQALSKGDLIAACDAEMGRVLLRKKEGHSYKDKISLDSIYEDYLAKNTPSPEQKKAKFEEIGKYLERHKGDVEYEWRICHLLSVMCADMGDKENSAKYMDRCLSSYPVVEYGEPSKFSKYQHLQNEYAGILWDTKGIEAAENYILDTLEKDKKIDYFFSGWWSERYQKTKTEVRFLPLLKRASASYNKRIINFPEKKPLIERYRTQLEREITRKEGEIKASLEKRNGDFEMTGFSQLSSPDTECALRFKILFEDGEKPFSLNFVWFQTEPNPDKFCSEALLTSDPSIALAKEIPQEARWIKVYAYRATHFSSTPLQKPFYDVSFPLDCSKIKPPSEETFILPLGNSSVRVNILPPADFSFAESPFPPYVGTMWVSGRNSMVMFAQNKEDGSFLFSPVWAGDYYLYFQKSHLYRVPFTVGEGEQLDLGEFPWPSGKVSGRILNAKGKPVQEANFQLYLLQYKDYNLPERSTRVVDGGYFTTDKSGGFVIENLLEGTYQPVFSDPYLPALRDWSDSGGPDNWPGITMEKITLERSENKKDLVLHLKK